MASRAPPAPSRSTCTAPTNYGALDQPPSMQWGPDHPIAIRIPVYRNKRAKNKKNTATMQRAHSEPYIAAEQAPDVSDASTVAIDITPPQGEVQEYQDIPGDIIALPARQAPEEDSPLLPPPAGTTTIRYEMCAVGKYMFMGEGLGIFLVIFAGALFTTSNVLQNMYVTNVNFFFILLVRAIMQVIVTDTDMKMNKQDVFGGVTDTTLRMKIVAQGFLGGFVLLGIFYSVTHVPLGDASAIFFLTPTWTFILAPYMLGESFGLFRILICFLMTYGATLISRPSFIFPVDPLPPNGTSGIPRRK